MAPKKIMIITGEESGDNHGANVVRAMLKKHNNLVFFGIGGKALKKAGTDILVEASELSVIGITEAFSKLPTLLKGMSIVKKNLKNKKPDLLILVDFPDFNLHAASHAKKLNIPVLYYISPQIWAWRSGRVKKIGRLVDHIAVIFPFEETLYRKHHIPVSFVGHPLLDQSARAANDEKDFKKEGVSVIGILPGSRHREVVQLLPEMLGAAEKIYSSNQELKFVISIAPSINRELVERMVEEHAKEIHYELISEPVHRVFEKCDFLIAVSGTVTLEAAIAGVPMIIIYRVSMITYLLGLILVKVGYISLVNLIAGAEVIPELIQGKAKSQNIADHVNRMINDRSILKAQKKKFIELRKILGGPGAAGQVAEIAGNMIL